MSEIMVQQGYAVTMGREVKLSKFMAIENKVAILGKSHNTTLLSLIDVVLLGVVDQTKTILS